MRRSVASKLALAMLAVALSSLLSALLISILVLRDAAEDTSARVQSAASRSIGDAIRREGDAMSAALAEQARNPVAAYDFATLREISRNLVETEDVLSVLVVGPTGHVFADGTETPALRRIRSPERRPARDYVVVEQRGELRFARRIEAGDRELGFVVLGLSLEPRERARTTLGSAVARNQARGQIALLRSALVASAVIALLAALIAVFLGRRLARPIVELQRASARVASGDLTTRVAPKSEDEIGRLGVAFNVMTEQLALARDAEREQQRMKRELEIAAQLQLSLLPPSPRHPGFAIAGTLKPADEVGGDFYDVLSDGDNALWITMGDVTGHGLEAGVIMLMAQTCFATLFAEDKKAPVADVLRSTNRLLHSQIADRLRGDKYITAQILAYRGAGRFELCGAHQWPIVVRSKSAKTEVVEYDGPWLGIYSDLTDVPVTSVQLEPGDVLCLYSDGIIETQNAEGELYELQRLADVLARAVAETSSLADAARAILANVDAFGVRQDDDRTLLLVSYRGDP